MSLLTNLLIENDRFYFIFYDSVDKNHYDKFSVYFPMHYSLRDFETSSVYLIREE